MPLLELFHESAYCECIRNIAKIVSPLLGDARQPEANFCSRSLER